jgi:hypothetical protein
MFTAFLLITIPLSLTIYTYYSFITDNELIQASSLIYAMIGLCMIVKSWPDSGLRKMYYEYIRAKQSSNI